MKTIRYGTFETNSSSMHTICISNEKIDLDSFEYTKLYGYGDDFDSGYCIYKDPQSKFSYALLCLIYYLRMEMCQEWETDRIPANIYNKYKKKLKDVTENVTDYFGNSLVEIVWSGTNDRGPFKLGLKPNDDSWELPCQGYIDHQSTPTESDEACDVALMWERPEDLFNFVFNKNSYIRTESD